ncbi:MAG TPA: TonB-dependent siderophore receptor [Longimicrobium sp.]|nr:TonB-dependent siderophore receptor [Longimicrobium sp.]
MRLLTAAGALCVFGTMPLPAQAARPTALALARVPATRAAAPGDTLIRVTFSIPALPLADALSEFSRQADVRVQVDAAAVAGARSHAVSGSFTAAEALRRMLEGTGLSARFNGVRTAVVTRGTPDEYALTTLNVVAGRSRGYASARSSTATRTDTPLRDTPQSVSVVTSEVIADQSMQGMADVVRYVPGVQMGQGEGHRDAPTIRGNASTADFFVDGVRDDAQYLRDLYNVERVEALKGSNAMIFGRGGGGGVLNRVSKQAGWAPVRTFTVETGSWGHKRTLVDVGQGLSGAVAARFNGMWENSEGFREFSALRRYGVNPTLALSLGRTRIDAGYERFHDRRNVDRGVPSYQGRPSAASVETFFGNPGLSYSWMDVHAANATLEHSIGAVTVRNRARFADYDKFYQNSYPGAVNADASQVALSAYNHAIGRRNWFNQTDVIGHATTGGVRHTLLVGAEVGRQRTDQVRNTGYYNNTATSFSVPFSEPTVTTPITFRQSATDADNRTVATVSAVYLQEQAELTPWLQALGGIRYDRFNVAYHNNRTDAELERRDELWSPRVGVVLKPVQPVSVYGSFSVSYLPSSGDQFTSLTATTETLEPERFTNREAGFKWDARANLSLTAAVYRLDRTNTSSPDPADPSRIVQTGEQRTTGFELGATGNLTRNWQIVGGFASQRARIVSTTSAAKAGQSVPLVPHQTMSLWNRVQLLPAVGVGLGVVRQGDMYAAIDNTVTLPGFTRADGALFLRVNEALGAQVNVENLFDKRYYATSQGNNNIMPGAKRTLRVSITARP